MIRLIRTDPAKNMQRFYALHVAPTLFGEFALVAEWGRIGQGGTVRQQAFASQEQADAALADRMQRKARRGYRLAS